MATNVDSQYTYTPPQQSSDSQYTYTTPLQGGVSTWQQPANLGAALTDTTPVASRPQANNIFNPFDVVQSTLSGAAENIPYLGKAMEYSPQTIPGQVGKVVGNIAPWLYGAKEFGIAGNAIAGGYQGITGAINKGENLSDIAKAGLVGAGTGAALSAGLPLVGKAVEAIQPTLASFMAKIPKEDYATVLENIKAGGNPFKGKSASLKDLIEQQKEFETSQAQALKAQQAGLTGSGNLNNDFVDSELNKFNDNAKTELQQFNDNAQQTQQTLKDIHTQEKNNAVQAATDLAHSTANTIQQVQKQYGKAVGQQANALKDTDNIPLSDINNLIDSNIKGASQGTELNPAGDEASSLGQNLKTMLLRGALKNKGLNDSQINSYINNKSGNTITGLEDSTRQALEAQGMNPLEINSHIDTLKQNGFLGNENAPTTNNIPQIDPDDLDISQSGLHVLKQYLQSRKINYDAESNPVSGIVKNIASDINGTLRDANPDYANVNDRYSELVQFLNKPENSFLNNIDSMASKFANISKNSAVTSNTLNKVKQFESIAKEAGLGQDISSNLENIKSLPDTHAQQLNDLKSTNDAAKQQLLDTHATNSQQLKDSLVKKKYDFMNQQQQQQQVFNENQALPLAMTSFNKFSPSSTESTISGFASPFTIGSAIFGHPHALIGHALYSGARSPLTQRAILEAYMNGRNIAPYVPTAVNTLSQYMQQPQGGQ